MSVNIAETFELLFDKNNKVAISELHKANICIYDDSMQQLVCRNIQKALKEIQGL